MFVSALQEQIGPAVLRCVLSRPVAPSPTAAMPLGRGQQAREKGHRGDGDWEIPAGAVRKPQSCSLCGSFYVCAGSSPSGKGFCSSVSCSRHWSHQEKQGLNRDRSRSNDRNVTGSQRLSRRKKGDRSSYKRKGKGKGGGKSKGKGKGKMDIEMAKGKDKDKDWSRSQYAPHDGGPAAEVGSKPVKAEVGLIVQAEEAEVGYHPFKDRIHLIAQEEAEVVPKSFTAEVGLIAQAGGAGVGSKHFKAEVGLIVQADEEEGSSEPFKVEVGPSAREEDANNSRGQRHAQRWVQPQSAPAANSEVGGAGSNQASGAKAEERGKARDGKPGGEGTQPPRQKARRDGPHYELADCEWRECNAYTHVAV